MWPNGVDTRDGVDPVHPTSRVFTSQASDDDLPIANQKQPGYSLVPPTVLEVPIALNEPIVSSATITKVWGASKNSSMTTTDPNLPELLVNGSNRSDLTILLAHGAGAAMDTEFMEFFAAGLADCGWRVIRFEFPYMAERRRTGKRRPPDREPMLRETWKQVIDSLKPKKTNKKLFIGGKSMGGRIASLIADDVDVSGLVCLGYPFHPIGKPDRLRVDHLKTIQTSTLILQGQRDVMGNQDEVSKYDLSRQIELCWLPDGDHSFKPRKSSGQTVEENWQTGIDAIEAFAKSLAKQ